MNSETETFEQPKITGYRQLNGAEVALMNEIKEHGERLGALVVRLQDASREPCTSDSAIVDARWVNIGTTDLQKGLMALTRAVARPTSF